MQLGVTIGSFLGLSASSVTALSDHCVCGDVQNRSPECINITHDDGKESLAFLTQITENIAGYANEAMMVNRIYAERFGHAFIVSREQALSASYGTDMRMDKIILLRRLLSDHSYNKVVWIDADLALVNHDVDVVDRLFHTYPTFDVLICRSDNDLMGLVNSGTVLLRNTPWTQAFLLAWLEWSFSGPESTDKAVRQNAALQHDQIRFSEIWKSNWNDAQKRIALLPAEALNSASSPFISAWRNPTQSPAVRLGGDCTPIREAIFRRMRIGLCAKIQGQRQNKDWPVSREWLRIEWVKGMQRHIRDRTPGCVKSSSFLTLAGQLERDGHFDAAEAIYKDGLRFHEGSTHSPNSDEAWTTNLVNNFGMMLSQRGRVKEALPLLEKNLQLRRQLHSEGVLTTVHVSDGLANFASVLEKVNREMEAEHLYKQSIKLNQKNFGSKHLSVATQLNNLAGLFFKRQRFQEALPVMQRAVKIKTAVLGKDHPDVKDLHTGLKQIRAAAGVQAPGRHGSKQGTHNEL